MQQAQGKYLANARLQKSAGADNELLAVMAEAEDDACTQLSRVNAPESWG
jgi:hypothetical protein